MILAFRSRWKGVLCAFMVMLSGCNEPTVKLGYKFAPQQKHTFVWQIEAESVLVTTSGVTRRRIEAETFVEQIVERTESDGSASVRTVVTVERLQLDGSPISPDPPVTAIATITSGGRVTSIETLSLPSALASQLDIERLLAEYLPPLPTGPVETGEEWAAPLRVKGETSQIALSGHGRLIEFKLADRKRLAHIRIERSGNIETSQLVGRAEVELTGTLRVRSDSMIDIDGGAIHGTEASSTSEFNISLSGGTDVGTLRIDIISVLKSDQRR